MHADFYYHVYNHANGEENLFRQEDNYHYFLMLWAKYIEPIADTYAYCLMPNHFHALIRVKTETAIRASCQVSDHVTIEEFVSKTFSNFFNAYAKAYNKMFDRRGSLFNRPFKSIQVDNDAYLTALITYIHRNPVHHGFRNTMGEWEFCSYDAFLSAQSTKLKRQEVLEWFGGIAPLVKSHQLEPTLPDTSLFIDW